MIQTPHLAFNADGLQEHVTVNAYSGRSKVRLLFNFVIVRVCDGSQSARDKQSLSRNLCFATLLASTSLAATNDTGYLCLSIS